VHALARQRHAPEVPAVLHQPSPGGDDVVKVRITLNAGIPLLRRYQRTGAAAVPSLTTSPSRRRPPANHHHPIPAEGTHCHHDCHPGRTGQPRPTPVVADPD
jgi:hypothetical protein